MSRRHFDACMPITRRRKVAETPKLTGRLSVPRLTFRTSSNVKRSEVKVIRPPNAVTEKNQPYLRNGKHLWVGRGHILAASFRYKPHSLLLCFCTLCLLLLWTAVHTMYLYRRPVIIRGVDYAGSGGPDHLKCHILSFKTVV